MAISNQMNKEVQDKSVARAKKMSLNDPKVDPKSNPSYTCPTCGAKSSKPIKSKKY